MRITVVIPTLNEAEHISRTLASVNAQTGLHEIIVADGGSEDQTLSILPFTAKVIRAARGRASQMNAGAAAATGDVLLFLHADTILPDGAFESIRMAITQGASGGIFRLRFDNPTFLLRVSSYVTRFEFKSICFGDRAIFATTEAFRIVGGFPNMPIFEDLEFTRRLSEAGPFTHLNSSVITSSRRFAASGAWRQQWLNARLWARYRTGGDVVALADKYRYPE